MHKIIAEKLKASKYGGQENLTTYLIDYATLSINKIRQRNGQKASSPSSNNDL